MIRGWIGGLDGAERDLLVRVLLLVPWELVKRNSGLDLSTADAVSAVLDAVDHDSAGRALEEVGRHGVEVVRREADSDMLPEHRRAEGLEFVIDPDLARRVGVRPRKVVIDRVQLAVSSFRASRSVATYRALVPRMLDHQEPPRREAVVFELLERCAASRQKWDSDSVLMGLADWMGDHPEDCGAPAVLDAASKGRNGAIRKAGAELAARMRRLDLLERMVRDDKDAGVRKRAAKLRPESPRQPGGWTGQGELFS